MLGPLAITALLFAAATGLGLAGGLGWLADRLGWRRRSERERRLAALCFALLPLEGAAFLWGLLVEPRWPEVTSEVETLGCRRESGFASSSPDCPAPRSR